MVFNPSLGIFVAVPEFARTRGKAASTGEQSSTTYIYTKKFIFTAIASALMIFGVQPAMAASVVNGYGVGLSLYEQSTQAPSNATNLYEIAIGSNAKTTVGTSAHVIRMPEGAENKNEVTNGTLFDVVNDTNSTTVKVVALKGQSDGYQASSVAFGRNSTASAGSVAFGDYANSTNLGVAIGSLSHATGISATAIGPAAFAKGNTALALGRQAVAVSDYAQAIGNVAVADGKGTLAIGHSAKAEGYRAIAIGSPDIEHADSASGDSGKQEGNVYQADAQSHAKGQDAIAIASASKAYGESAIAFGQGAIAGAYSGTGADAKVTGDALHAIAFGDQSRAGKDNALAFGNKSEANGINAVSIGNQAFATNDSAISVGNVANASANNAISIGNAAKAEQIDSTAIGTTANARSINLTDAELANEGRKEIKGNVAIGNGSIAGGGDPSVAIGDKAHATGNQSLALGANTSASGNSSIAIGGDDIDTAATDKIAGTNSPTVKDAYFKLTGNTIETGNGTYKDTTASGPVSAAVGTQALASGAFATAFGTKTESTGLASSAIGMGSKATADAALAQGAYARATAANAIAFGTSQASAENAIAIGNRAQATHENSVALGSKSVTTAATAQTQGTVNGITYGNFAGVGSATNGSVSVGDAGKERQIKNVAAGEISDTSADAINGSQLYAVADKLSQGFTLDTSAAAGGEKDTGSTAAEAIKPGDKIEMVAGKNMTVKQEQNGKITYATKDSVSFSDITVPTDPAQPGSNPITINNNGINVGGKTVSNVKNNLPEIKPDNNNTTNQSAPTNITNNNAATVGDVLNAGWNLQGNDKAVDFVKAYDTVNFIDGNATTATVKAADDGTVSTVKYDVKVDGSTIKIVDGKLTVNNAALSTAQNYFHINPENRVVTASGTNNLDAVDGVGSATGAYALAAGYQAQSSGNSSTAVGKGSQATAAYATAFGNDAWSTGSNGTALGSGSRATGGGSLAVGAAAQSQAFNAMAIGSGASIYADGSRAVAIGAQANSNHANAVALGSGSITDAAVSTNNATVNGITYDGFAGVSPIATVSVGSDTQKRTITNVAAGRIEKDSTDAINGSQLYAVAEKASEALNKRNYFHTNPENRVVAASGTNNLDAVDGVGNATGPSSLAAGYGAEASGINTNAIGYSAGKNATNTNYSTFVGSRTGEESNGASVDLKLTAGYNTYIGENSGLNSAGSHNTATGHNAFNEGSGDANTVFGHAALYKVDGSENASFGAYAGQRSTGDKNTSVGAQTGRRVTGNNNTALGYNAGSGITASNTVSVGNAAMASKDGAVAVGNKAQASALNSIATGNNTQASGVRAIATGFEAKAVGVNSIATGNNTQANNLNSIAIGNTANSSANFGIALGANTNVTVLQAVAIGSNASAKDERAVALGANSVTAAAVGTTSATLKSITYGSFAGTSPVATVSVGSQGSERTITNVAAGRITATSTDAINGSQLYMTNDVLGNLANSVVENFGGDAALNPNKQGDITFTNIGGTGQNNIHDAIKFATTTVKAGNNTTVNKANAANEYTVNAWDTTVSAKANGGVNITPTINDTNMTRAYELSVNVDNSSIKIVDGKLTVNTDNLPKTKDTVTIVQSEDKSVTVTKQTRDC